MGACGSKGAAAGTPGGAPGAATAKGGEKAGDLTLLVIGLDNSGKSTFTMALNGDMDPFVVPTVGFSAPIKKKGLHGADVTFFDLGGGMRIRGVWPNYFADVHGVVYVVDASDQKRLKESADELANSLTHPMIVGKPLLVLANKQDVPGSLNEADLSSAMALPSLCTLSRYHVQACIAKPSCNNNAFDTRIDAGLQWLVEAVKVDYGKLDARRRKEMQEFAAQEEARRKKQREDYEAKQAAKQKDKEAEAEAAEGDKAAEGSSSGPSTAPEATAPKLASAAASAHCFSCKVKPAERRCAAAGWMPVCDPCGVKLEAEAAAKKEAELEAERKKLEEEDARAAAAAASTGGASGSNAAAPAAEAPQQPAEVAPAAAPVPEPAAPVADATPAVAADTQVPPTAAAAPVVASAADVADAPAASGAGAMPDPAPAPVAAAADAAPAPAKAAEADAPAAPPAEAAAAEPTPAAVPAPAKPSAPKAGGPLCALCKAEPAIRKSAVPLSVSDPEAAAANPDKASSVSWKPVCDACGTSVESGRAHEIAAKLSNFVPVAVEENETEAANNASAAAGRQATAPAAEPAATVAPEQPATA